MPKLNRIIPLVGADPELFLRDPVTKSLVSAHTLVPGNKITPFKVERGAIQVDGAAAEFNIDPTNDSLEFVTNIQAVMAQLAGYTKGLEFVLDPAVTFEPTYFSSLPDEVRELGCNPDFNAWTGLVNDPPDGNSTTMRSASGHIHVGFTKNRDPLDENHFEDCRTVARELDYTLGIWSLLWDKDPTRRQLYGKAGAFRPKPYGVEYRTLSNVWLRSSTLQRWIFHSVQATIEGLQNRNKSLHEQFGEFARDVIDGNKLDWNTTSTGQQVIAQTGLMMPDLRELNAYGKPKPISKTKTPEEKLKEALRDSAAKMKADPNFYKLNATKARQTKKASVVSQVFENTTWDN